MKATSTKCYDNKDRVQSKSFCLHKTGFVYKIQLAFILIKSKL